jgi:hypothetical protein
MSNSLNNIELPPTPKDVFQRFIEFIPHANIEQYVKSEPWTEYATEFFQSWGTKLGYEVYCKEKFGVSKEYLSLDVVWMKKILNRRFIYLALEHENVVDDVSKDELNKLIDVKALLKVLITYFSDQKSRNDFVADVEWAIRTRALKIPGERYLLIIGACPERYKRTETYVQFFGYVFDNTGYLNENLTSHITSTKKI